MDRIIPAAHEDFVPLRIALAESVRKEQISLQTALTIMRLLDDCDSGCVRTDDQADGDENREQTVDACRRQCA
ncbi:MAG: hypothetical protein ACLQNE_02330 [Thermoguttaceae bacterium]